VNPFNLKFALSARHAQHVALVHFPIALFITAVAFDLIAQWTKRRGFRDTAYYKVRDTDEEFSYTFDKTGAYLYYCSIHPKMTGKVVVQ
jgi:plastocyanin